MLIQSSRIYSVTYIKHGQEQGNITDEDELSSIWRKISKILKSTSAFLCLVNIYHVFEKMIWGLLTSLYAHNDCFYWKGKIQGRFEEYN